jgi:squalene-hopene/tetraprenyl-beta-curcumene cyclase
MSFGFNALDRLLKACDGLWPKQLRRRAIETWRGRVLEGQRRGRLAQSSAMATSVMMLDLLGCEDHPARAIARKRSRSCRDPR